MDVLTDPTGLFLKMDFPIMTNRNEDFLQNGQPFRWTLKNMYILVFLKANFQSSFIFNCSQFTDLLPFKNIFFYYG